VKHTTGIPHSPTGQALVERCHRTIKEYLNKQKRPDITDPQQRLSLVLFTFNHLCLTEGREEPPVVIHHGAVKSGHPQMLPHFFVHYQDPKTRLWGGP
ncbi:IGEB protein, partial [Machaerirhynchus nigripectus]|nr:IGEB protein [Machaerirhynchus nigripectus]